MLTAPGQEVAWGEMSVGAWSVFAAAGLREVSRLSARRVVMRVEFGEVDRGRTLLSARKGPTTPSPP
jgi:hypothetical protein